MKRHGNLFEAFSSFSNLLSAYRKAKKGTRGNQETGNFFLNMEAELFQLQDELLSCNYYPKPYRHFQIYDPKERTISVAAFRDRVVHHALVNVLEPVYEQIFIPHSYATRKGKGTHSAILLARSLTQLNEWFLKSDVDKFFDSIHQEKLVSIISQKIKDKKLMEVTSRILYNGGSGGVGLPIGNLTSQFFANVYLHELDHFVKHHLKIRFYIRYMDDFVLFNSDKMILKNSLLELEQFLYEKLGLQLKQSATYINRSSNGLTFLGKRIYPHMIRIARPNLIRIKRRMRQREGEYLAGYLEEEKFLSSMNSYWACLSFGNTYNLRKRMLYDK